MFGFEPKAVLFSTHARSDVSPGVFVYSESIYDLREAIWATFGGVHGHQPPRRRPRK